MGFKIAIRVVYLLLLLAVLYLYVTTRMLPLSSLSATISGVHPGEPKAEAVAGRACRSYTAASGKDAVECSDPKGELTLAFSGPEDAQVVSFLLLQAPLSSQDACDAALESRYGTDSQKKDPARIRLAGVGEVRLLGSWDPAASLCSISADAVDLAEDGRARPLR